MTISHEIPGLIMHVKPNCWLLPASFIFDDEYTSSEWFGQALQMY
jgi:hypothetical protein